jgi:16S rRNA (uracil1498-N3)-methyltransferase
VKLHRFYDAVRTPENFDKSGFFTVPDPALVNQLKKVFRFHVGDTVIVFNGDGQDHQCVIKEFTRDSVVFQKQKSEPSRFMAPREAWLCASVVKKDNFEWIAEKATELGVSHIVPVLSDRSEKKSLNMERVNKIVVEAAEQSGRGDIPAVHEIFDLEKSIQYIKEKSPDAQIVAFHTEGELVQDEVLDKSAAIAVFIGPEGGWSEGEVEMFHRLAIPLVSLGKQVLRAETAVVAALTKVLL